MIDRTGEELEITVRKVGNTYRVWVNGKDGCLLRMYDCPRVTIETPQLTACADDNDS